MSSCQQIFITGTGTDVGKTLISLALGYGLHLKHHQVCYWKPVQTGASQSDTEFINTHCQNSITTKSPDFIFQLPASPDQAARHEQRSFATVKALVDSYYNLLISRLRTLKEHNQTLVIEGAGGVLVPLNDAGETWLDFMKAARLAALVISKNELGTINHSCLTINALEHKQIPVLGLVLSGNENKDNIQSIQALCPKTPIHFFPQLPSLEFNEFFKEQALQLADFTINAYQHHIRQKLQNDNFFELRLRDQKYIWHPFTQHKNNTVSHAIKAAKGVFLELEYKQRVIDGTSSWWVNTVGHGREEIANAIFRQQQTLDHTLFANLTHDPAVELAQRVIALTDNQLQKVFYSDNGSTAVEVALKMAVQFWKNQGVDHRQHFVAFKGGYHGDTFGAMSVSMGSEFHTPFKDLCFRSYFLTPQTIHRSHFSPDGMTNLEDNLNYFKDFIATSHQDIAALIIEPLIQGAGGMLIQPKEWLVEIVKICKAHDILIIFDEVFTGLGRVGDDFAFKRADLSPDIICIAKALTGGTLPLAMTLTTDKVFNAFLSDKPDHTFLHGHSYTGNPIACAAALAAFKIYDNEKLAQKARELEHTFRTWLDSTQDKLKLQNARTIGGILAFELPNSGFHNYNFSEAKHLTDIGIKHGIYLRPLGNTVYFMPPLVISKDETFLALKRLEKTIEGYKSAHHDNAPSSSSSSTGSTMPSSGSK